MKKWSKYGTRDKGKATEQSRQSISEPRDDCPVCHGTGWEVFEKDGSETAINSEGRKVQIGEPGEKFGFARRCPACFGDETMANIQKQKSQIPATFYDAQMADFDWHIYRDDKGNEIDMSLHRKMVDAFLNEYKEWKADTMGLYLWSHTRGCGKTFLASVICNELISRYHAKPKFVSVSDLIAMDKDDDGRIFELMDADVLVLDDLGQQNNGNKWLEDILFRVLDHRMQSQLITIVTSNVKIDQLAFDDRVTDRLNAMTYEIPLPDYCVRSRGSQRKKRDLLQRIGLIGKAKDDNEEAGGQMELPGTT